MEALGLIVVFLIVLLVYRSTKQKESTELGMLKLKRPAKVRLVYSKKLKNSERPKITSQEDAANLFRAVWSSQMEIKEEFMVLLLDKSHRVLGYQHLSKGGLDGTVVDARIVFAAALQSLASAIILAHNHPSGNLKPSGADKQITLRIKRLAELHGIKLLDHIILTKESYTSFADEGIL
jgi:DNA repair protein RadC